MASFIAKMHCANAKVIMSAMITGQAPIATPYASHSPTPKVKALYMPSDTPLTSRVRKVCQACSSNDEVVSVAAA